MFFLKTCRGAVQFWEYVKISVTVAIALCSQSSFAQWQIVAPDSIFCNTGTTISLEYRHGNEPIKPDLPGNLWFANQGSTEIILPETVSYINSAASMPVFVRGEGGCEVQVYDDVRKSTTVLVFPATKPRTVEGPRWIPHLSIEGDEKQSVLAVNKKATATLTLIRGTGVMPPSAHISVVDHRGRVVSSRFHNTFDLVAGLDSVQIPSAGYYEVSLKLLSDARTSLPTAIIREAEAIPFGKTIADLTEPEVSTDGVTTQTVVGVRVALEHIPTTATIVGEDRNQVVVLARPSKEIQKNKWPFVIAGADLVSMPIAEQKQRGAELVRWQRRLGSSFAPVILEWGTIQKSPGSFQWFMLNSALPIYRKAIVRPLLTVVGKSAWSNELPTETSATLEAWTGYTRQLSEKYLDMIWGLQCWKYPEEAWPTSEDYGKVVDATINGFQMPNNQRVPTPPLIIGGTHHFDESFFEPLMTSDTVKSISGISFDLYPKDMKQSPEENGFAKTLTQVAEFIKKQNTETIKLWITGTGWPNGPDGVTEEIQANYLVRTHVMALSHGAYKLYWNSLIDKNLVPWGINPAEMMGLLDRQLFPKKSGVAYNILTYMMSGVEPLETTRQGNVFIYKFNIPVQNNKWAGILYVAWTESPGMQDIRLEMTHGGGVYALDYLGAEVQTRKVTGDSDNSIQGSYSIPVGFEPVFIWDAGGPGQAKLGHQEKSAEKK